MRRSHGRIARRSSAIALVTLLLVGAGCTPGDEGGEEAEGGQISLTILANATEGGKNAATAAWVEDYVIPNFEQQMEDDGKNVQVEFVGTGVDDEDYKARISLDLRSGRGEDILGFDQFWLAEFVAAEFLEPLNETVGEEVDDWEGWDQIPEAVQGSLVLEGERYGIPAGTDGRVLFFNKKLFAEAGLPEDWQPESWDDIIAAGRTLKQELPGVTPLQINAGAPMGEATTLQGVVPVWLGTGPAVYDDEQGLWLGDTLGLRETLGFFETIYGEGLGDAQLQQRADGRDRSFQLFSKGKIAVLAESDYFWRSVISSTEDALFPMKNRDEDVGWAKIPAREPGAGFNGQDFVSASGGTGYVLNSNTEHPEEAWALLSFMGSEEATLDFVEREPRITGREDVNEQSLADDPMLSFIAEEVLPITWYRPGFQEYPQASIAIAEMVESVIAGRTSPDEAARNYTKEIVDLVGEDAVVTEGT